MPQDTANTFYLNQRFDSYHELEMYKEQFERRASWQLVTGNSKTLEAIRRNILKRVAAAKLSLSFMPICNSFVNLVANPEIPEKRGRGKPNLFAVVAYLYIF